MYTIDQVEESVEGFDRGLMESYSSDRPNFALREIAISDVLDMRKNPVIMTEEEIKSLNDEEYIQSMTEYAKKNGQGCFHPIVVIDRGDWFEWVDGRHRATALTNAGIETTLAYIQI